MKHLLQVAASIQSGNGCGILGVQCDENEYCWRTLLDFIGMCTEYGEKGDSCNEKVSRHNMWSSTCVEAATTASPTTIQPETTSTPVVTKA
ncbi:hypothetical protein CEXT_214071 [Caerostris extrusa]|uniref:Uncharacterized protein n=1 Tax=Caerostris extrusa TaxID=172846 RepID=A0AAV4Y5A5_CAEEX|nr:hypothetical protein CEXT_214071 [Caerostris extrusa]